MELKKPSIYASELNKSGNQYKILLDNGHHIFTVNKCR